MGNFLNSFLTGCARNKSSSGQDKPCIPVKLIEPSIGRIVKLEVTEQNERVAQMYMDQLTTYAESLGKSCAEYTVTGKTIQIVFADGDIAENTRQSWEKMK